MELIQLIGRALSLRWWGALAFAPHPTWRRVLTVLRSSSSPGIPPWRWAVDASPLRVDSLPVQGRLGDCWIIAPLLAIALHSPGFIASGLRELPDGRVQVRLFDRGAPIAVTVDRAMPVLASTGSWPDDRWRLARTSHGQPGWAGVIESAVAQRLAGSYRGIERGLATFGIPLLTGIPSRLYLLRFPSAARIQSLVEAGHVVVASTHPLSGHVLVDSQPLPANHVMAVVGAEEKTGDVWLRNPWRPERILRLSRSQFRLGFLSMDVSVRALPR